MAAPEKPCLLQNPALVTHQQSNVISSAGDKSVINESGGSVFHIVLYNGKQRPAGGDVPSYTANVSLDDTECSFHEALLSCPPVCHRKHPINKGRRTQDLSLAHP